MQMLSGDNKGYASYLMEKRINGNTTLPGKGSFVAAFASTNLGDVSPNTAGPRCLDTGESHVCIWVIMLWSPNSSCFCHFISTIGLPCDVLTSTCGGNTLLCVASGPGKNMFESTEIIGHKQYDLATSLFDNATETLSGAVSFRHSFVDMSNLTVILESGGVVRTCPAALGYAFAAGTTDGPGA
jgi:neutral ceramidase